MSGEAKDKRKGKPVCVDVEAMEESVSSVSEEEIEDVIVPRSTAPPEAN